MRSDLGAGAKAPGSRVLGARVISRRARAGRVPPEEKAEVFSSWVGGKLLATGAIRQPQRALHKLHRRQVRFI